MALHGQEPCPFGSELRQFALVDLVIVFFSAFLNKILTHTICIISHGLYIFTLFFTALQTTYVLNKEIFQFLVLTSTVYNQERFEIKSARTVLGTYNFVKGLPGLDTQTQ